MKRTSIFSHIRTFKRTPVSPVVLPIWTLKGFFEFILLIFCGCPFLNIFFMDWSRSRLSTDDTDEGCFVIFHFPPTFPNRTLALNSLHTRLEFHTFRTIYIYCMCVNVCGGDCGWPFQYPKILKTAKLELEKNTPGTIFDKKRRPYVITQREQFKRRMTFDNDCFLCRSRNACVFVCMYRWNVRALPLNWKPRQCSYFHPNSKTKV